MDSIPPCRCTGDIAGNVGFFSPGFIHTAVIRGLRSRDRRPNERVQYRFGSETVGWSAKYSFLIPPPSPSSGVNSDPLKFLAIVDVGNANEWINIPPPIDSATSAKVLPFSRSYLGNSSKLGGWLERESGAHLTLVPGDLSYANGVRSLLNLGLHLWDFVGPISWSARGHRVLTHTSDTDSLDTD